MLKQLYFRKLHRKIALIFLLPLLLSAMTGVFYRVGRTWFGFSDEFGDMMMMFHEGRFLGKPLVPVYVLFTGLGLLTMAITGITMLKKRENGNKNESTPTKLTPRSAHRILAPIFFLPLVLSALTGIIYRVGKAWFGLSSDQVKFFMKIHQGSYLGSELRVFYVLLIGLGLLGILWTGFEMKAIFRRKKSIENN